MDLIRRHACQKTCGKVWTPALVFHRQIRTRQTRKTMQRAMAQPPKSYDFESGMDAS